MSVILLMENGLILLASSFNGRFFMSMTNLLIICLLHSFIQWVKMMIKRREDLKSKGFNQIPPSHAISLLNKLAF